LSPGSGPSIVTLTMNPCIDESTSVGHVVPDRKLRCREAAYEPGGGGINVARALHRLGARTLAIFPSGGPAGSLLRTLLEREGVPQLPLPITGWTRENVNVR
jgi:6-phosphofructokinase 2